LADQTPTAGPPAVNVTAALAEFVVGLQPAMLDTATRERVKDLLIDAVACALAADRSEEMRQIEPPARLFGRDGSLTVIGSTEGAAPAAAVLLNGYRITALTFCDVYTPAHMHVTPEVVPPALAIAERDGVSGMQLLIALVAGFEVATRVAAGLDYPRLRQRGWHTPGVAGPFGGAAAVSSLLALPADHTRNALGLAGSQSAGTWAAWGTPTVKFHQARGALNGLLAGLLAETGFTASDDVLGAVDGGLLSTYAGGGNPEAIVEKIGQAFELMRISLRPWPSATPLQPIVTGLFSLLEGGRLRPRHNVHLAIHVAPAVFDAHVAFRHPGGKFEALLSIHHAAAAILLFGQLGLAQYEPSVYLDPALARVIDQQIEVVADERLVSTGCRIEVRDGDGDAVVESVTAALGHPDNPAPRDLIVDKFRGCADGVLDPTAASEALDMIARLEDLADVRQLTRALRPGPHHSAKEEP
jgi:2-methylcitrate dehydratase PrpD